MVGREVELRRRSGRDGCPGRCHGRGHTVEEVGIERALTSSFSRRLFHLCSFHGVLFCCFRYFHPCFPPLVFPPSFPACYSLCFSLLANLTVSPSLLFSLNFRSLVFSLFPFLAILTVFPSQLFSLSCLTRYFHRLSLLAISPSPSLLFSPSFFP